MKYVKLFFVWFLTAAVIWAGVSGVLIVMYEVPYGNVSLVAGIIGWFAGYSMGGGSHGTGLICY
jgi:hypothetical protein